MTNRNKKIYLHQNEENEMEIYGYQFCLFRTTITWIFYLLTLGLLRLFYHWFQQLQLYSTHRQCSLQNAQKVLIIDKFMGKHKTYFVKDIKIVSVANTSNASKINIFLEIGAESVSRELTEMKMFTCKKSTYVFDPTNDQFYKLIGLEKNMPYSDLHIRSLGLTINEENNNRLAYGRNIIETPVNTVLELLVLEILNPFYMFQLFSIIIFICEFYYSTVVGIIIATIFVVFSSVYQTRQNQKNLHGTVRSNNEVTVCRKIKSQNTESFEEKLEIISSTSLVPGDVIIIPEEGCEMQSDCVLLEGGTCIVNESMLTGESVPVTKSSLPISSKLVYDVETDKNHTLYCGTQVVQIRHHGNGLIKALVIRTGFLTTKGQLVRSILYPPPTDYRFDRDAYKFLAILGVIATMGFIYTLLYNFYHQQPVYDTIIKGLDLYTTVISPAIPAVMTVGRLFAIGRLKKQRIFCINSRVINVTGSIDCVCFDKTGTLTEDGMDLYAVIPLKPNDKIELDNPIHASISTRLNEENKSLLYGMVTCHSVSLIHNHFYGDPLDVKMFESSNWIIKEHNSADTIAQYGTYVPTVVRSPTDDFEIGVIHQYQFSSNLQRMCVITKIANENDYVAYCKGSPEKIVSLSKPDSVPQNIFSILKNYTKKGYRVIAIGKRVLSDIDLAKVKHLERDEVEMDLEFVGLIAFENRVKKETFPVIQILKNADMKIVMITGDNIQTAISVACECGIIENDKEIIDVSVFENPDNDELKLMYTKNNDYELRKDSIGNREFPSTNNLTEEHIEMPSSCYVLTGDTWATIRNKFPDELERIVKYGAVFARMSVDQKQQLIQELKNQGFCVAMCGDGANDCGALRTAHAGISLSDTEASVASPFTAKDPNISCVPKIITEGRAALTTSFSILKFIVASSMLQFTGAIILYLVNSNLTDGQYLYCNIIILVYAFVFGATKSSERPLGKIPPHKSILSIEPLLSLIFQIIINWLIQSVAMYWIRQFNWYEPFHPKFADYGCYEEFAVFTVSALQYSIIVIVFSKGEPYRKPFYTNFILMAFLLVSTAFSLYIDLDCPNFMTSFFEFKKLPPSEFNSVVLILSGTNLIVAFLFEEIVMKLISNTNHKYSLKTMKDDNIDLVTNKVLIAH